MIIGLCRFSFLAADRGGWQSTPRDVEQARKLLFNRERLENRFRLFERYTLPSVREQTDKDFSFLILTSDALPKPSHDRLMDITAGVPNIKVMAFPAQNSSKLIRRVFSDEFGSAGQRVSFRIDDDDGLSVNFIRRLRRTAEGGRSSKPFFVTFSRGINVSHQGERVDWTREFFYPFLSMGLAFSASGDETRCVYDFRHRSCFRHFDAAVLSGRPGYLRCLHGSNDTRGKLYGSKHFSRATLAETAAKFEKEFPYLATAA